MIVDRVGCDGWGQMKGVRVQSSPVSESTALGDTAQLDHADRAREPAQFDFSVRLGGDAFGEPFDLHRRHQYLDVASVVTQAGSHVDRRADVIVTFEQQRMTGCDAGADGERVADLGRPALEVEREADGVVLLDGHAHAAVAEPLGDPHSPFGSDRSDDRAKRAQDAPGRVVAEGRRVVREPGQVHEHEGSGNAHVIDVIRSNPALT